LFERNGWNYSNFSISASFDASSCARKRVRVQVTFGGERGLRRILMGFRGRLRGVIEERVILNKRRLEDQSSLSISKSYLL